MSNRTTPFTIVNQGCVKMSHTYGYLLLGNDECVTFYVDLDTKYPEIIATGSGSGVDGDNAPLVILGATEYSLHLHPDHSKDDATWIEFPEFPGWNVHTAQVSKYTIAVALTNPAKEFTHDTQDEGRPLLLDLLLRTPVRWVYRRSGWSRVGNG